MAEGERRASTAYADIPAFVHGLTFDALPVRGGRERAPEPARPDRDRRGGKPDTRRRNRQRICRDTALRQRPQRTHPVRRPPRRTCRCRVRRRDDDRRARRSRRSRPDQGARGRRAPPRVARADRRDGEGRAGGVDGWSRLSDVPRRRLRGRDTRGHRAARDDRRLSLLRRVERAWLRCDRRASSSARRREDPACARSRRVLRSARPDSARVRVADDGEGRLRLGRARRRDRGAARARGIHRGSGTHRRARRRPAAVGRHRRALADLRAVLQGVSRLPLGATRDRGRARAAARARVRRRCRRRHRGRKFPRSRRPGLAMCASRRRRRKRSTASRFRSPPRSCSAGWALPRSTRRR